MTTDEICRKLKLQAALQFIAEDWKGTAIVGGLLWLAALAYILIEG